MSKYLISLILLSVISMGVSAQRITRQYNNVSFSAALKDLLSNIFLGCSIQMESMRFLVRVSLSSI